MSERQQRVVEKYYSPRELSFLLGFNERFWRERCQSGDLVTREGDQVIAAPLEIAGELRIPASAVNAFLARNPYRYDAGVKARNQAELRRRLENREAA